MYWTWEWISFIARGQSWHHGEFEQSKGERTMLMRRMTTFTLQLSKPDFIPHVDLIIKEDIIKSYSMTTNTRKKLDPSWNRTEWQWKPYNVTVTLYDCEMMKETIRGTKCWTGSEHGKAEWRGGWPNWITSGWIDQISPTFQSRLQLTGLNLLNMMML